MSGEKQIMSVANDINALALVNIQDIFRFTLCATDSEIEERYGSEERAVAVAKEYLDIAMRAHILEHPIAGWSMKYQKPIKGDEGKMADHTAYFYDIKETEEKE